MLVSCYYLYMREIEVKAKLDDRARFLVAAKKLGIQFDEAITQEDTTYESELPYHDPRWNVFRLRKQEGKHILTMKHKASTRSRDNHEYETIVEDENEVIKMLSRLGFRHGVYVHKQRQVAHFNDLELCLDEIKGLGWFVEVEKLADDNADVDAIQNELWSLLQQLGLRPQDRVHHGYDTLMRRAQAA